MIHPQNRLVGGALAALTTGGLLIAGGGAAAASDATPPPNQITLSPEQSARICDDRIPALLARIDRLEERIGGDADTPGSTAWLESRVAQAREAGRDDLADRLQNRLENRTATAERLAEVQERVEAFRGEQCA